MLEQLRQLAPIAFLLVTVGCGRSVEENDGSGGAGAGSSSGSKSSGKGSGPGGTQSSGTEGTGGAQSSGTQGSGGAETSGTQSSGATMTSGTTVSTGTGTMMCAGFGDACTNCMSGGCADVWCGCRNNPDCLPLFNCWQACGVNDQACVQNCMVQYESAVSAALLVSNCAATACDSSCNWGQSVPPCTECIYTDCSNVMNACFADAECIPLLDCLDACPPQSIQCQSQCYDAHQSGIDPLQAVIDCSNMACGNVCMN
jgi:hypothetical protein